jgi:glycosyltransferase involved in cell wall biosynthesis
MAKANYFGVAMKTVCRVGVIVPIYDESAGTILRLLLSLAEQEADKDLFEVVCVVNNSRAQTLSGHSAFLANQTALGLLLYVSGRTARRPEHLTAEQINICERIRHSGLSIVILDSSSLQFAKDENNVGIARRLAAKVLEERFTATGLGRRGILVSTDCDCKFSPNALGEIIDTFDSHKINGAAGLLISEPDPDFFNPDLLRRVTEVSDEISGRLPAQSSASSRVYYKNEVGGSILNTGQNMALLLDAYLRAGGFDPLPSLEDYYFGARVSALPGGVVRNLAYSVTTLSRPSQRAGLAAFGRRIAFILDSIENFRHGESDNIYKLDNENIKGFLFYLSRLSGGGTLDVKWLKDLMTAFGVRQDGLTDVWLKQAADILKRGFSDNALFEHLQEVDNLLLEHFYHRLPTVDVTERFLDIVVRG